MFCLSSACIDNKTRKIARMKLFITTVNKLYCPMSVLGFGFNPIIFLALFQEK